MPWGFAIGAVGSIAGGLISSNGAQSAASDQAGAQQAATAEQEREFNVMNQIYAPQRNLGYGADQLLAQLYGISNPNANTSSGAGTYNPAGGGNPGGGVGGFGAGLGINTPGIGTGAFGTGVTSGSTPANGQASNYLTGGSGSPDYSGFYNSPGYKFSLQMGQQATNRNAAAGGSLYSANTLGAVNQNAQGIASQQYNNYVQQLMGIAGLGGQAAAGTANAAYNTGANISQGIANAGNANASGALGSANAWSNAINQMGGAAKNAPWSNIFGGSDPSGAGMLQTGSNGIGFGVGADA